MWWVVGVGVGVAGDCMVSFDGVKGMVSLVSVAGV
jgi:hypothetical protein